MPILTGGEALVRMLQLHGVDYAFGMGGFQLLPYYDALTQQTQISHVLIRDEKHGAFAADAYARVANRPAVADATLGPGATNLVSGAAESFGASIPLILLTGEVNSLIGGRGATQESDQFGMLRPTTKLSVRLDRIERIPELIRRACAVATAGRPGPVHVDVPEEVAHGSYDFPEGDLYADPDACRVGGRRTRPDASLVDRAAELLGHAEHPVVIAGGGVHLAGAYRELRSLVELAGIPVATTITGKGALAETHELSVGVCGRFSRIANDFIEVADVVLVVGSKLGEIATKRWSLIIPGTKVIQIDVDPTELGKVQPLAVGMPSDAALGLSDLYDCLEGSRQAFAGRRRAAADRVAAAMDEWRREASSKADSDAAPIEVARVLRDVRAVLPEESIVVADGGFAAHWSALFYEAAGGRTYIANRGHAAIGYGVPGGLGAKLAAPDQPVVSLCGDAGFAMALAELC